MHVPDFASKDGGTTKGNEKVTIKGRQFGPVGHTKINAVTYGIEKELDESCSDAEPGADIT